MLPQIEHKTLMGAGFFASWWWNYGVTFINVPESSWQRSKDGYHKTAILTAREIFLWQMWKALQWSVIDRCGHQRMTSFSFRKHMII